MATKPILDELDMEYAGALEDYVARGGEAALEQAYEVGRRALSEKLAILDMVAIHHRVLAALLRRSVTREEDTQLVAKAGEFLGYVPRPWKQSWRSVPPAILSISTAKVHRESPRALCPGFRRQKAVRGFLEIAQVLPHGAHRSPVGFDAGLP